MREGPRRPAAEVSQLGRIGYNELDETISTTR